MTKGPPERVVLLLQRKNDKKEMNNEIKTVLSKLVQEVFKLYQNLAQSQRQDPLLFVPKWCQKFHSRL